MSNVPEIKKIFVVKAHKGELSFEQVKSLNQILFNSFSDHSGNNFALVFGIIRLLQRDGEALVMKNKSRDILESILNMRGVDEQLRDKGLSDLLKFEVRPFVKPALEVL